MTRLAQLVSALVLLVLLLAGYMVYAENRAEAKARKFCGSVHPGETVEGLIERAITAGADARISRWVKRKDEEDWLPVTFSGFTPLSRHICSIKSAANRISQAEYLYLD